MRRAAAAATLILISAAMTGCVVAPYRPYGAYYGGGPGYESGGEVVVDTPPPAPYVETIPVAPFLGALWIAGYWGWSGGRHSWVPGHYEHPRAGYRWEPHRWAEAGGHWHLHGGGWVRQ